MNITYLRQDVTDVEAGIIVHGCNCQGVMGSGVALAIRNKFPEAYQQYLNVCTTVPPRELLGWTQNVCIKGDLFVVNMFTQFYYGRERKKYASVEAIAAALFETLEFANSRGLPLYMPKVGCGLGGLDWETDVRPIVKHLSNEFPDVQIFVCEI